MVTDGEIRFRLKLDRGNFHHELNSSIVAATKMSNSAASAINSISKKNTQQMIQNTKSISNVKEKEYLSDKQRIMKLAAEYRKAGMNQSDAMKKAWSEIERTSSTKSKKVRDNIKGLGNQSKMTASEMAASFNSGFKSIKNMITKVLTIGAVTAFTKSCLDLGSDLSEVQNVVDVTFGNMTSKVNKFASTAIEQFGLSETVAKKMMGTYGAMSKSFGFNPKEVYDMSEAITGLTADVASFYNLETDEAYTKLKSIWTGETESLKELGVVMTQTALDQYALNEGFGKTTASMTEQEKVMLRYRFVQSQLSDAAGDFARTSDGWANQTRVLTLRFQQLKATLGQGFINLFTPIVKMLNAFISGIQNAANAFLRLTEIITGKESGSLGNVSANMADISNTAGEAGNNISGMGDAAAGAAKKAQRALMGFDQIQKINEDSSSGGSGGSGGTGTSSATNGVISSEMEKATQAAGKLEETIKRIKSLFSEGFKIGLGDTDFSKVENHINGIKNSLLNIFSDKSVQNAADNFFNSFVTNLGKITGSTVSIGETLSENLLGGIDKYLSQNKEKIKKSIVDIFNIESEKAEIVGNFSVAVADIFTIFRSDNAKQITADIISIFSDGFTNVLTLSQKLGRDVLNCLLTPITENRETLKKKFGDLLEPVSGIVQTIKDSCETGFKNIQAAYDKYLKPAFDTVKDTFSDFLSGKFGNFLSDMKDDLSKISTNLKPIVEKLRPIQDFFTNITAAQIGVAITALGTVCINVFSSICTIIEGTTKTLSGIVEFISGAFTGVWKKAFNGLKTTAEGIFDTLVGSILSLFGFDKYKDAISKLGENITEAWNNIKAKFKGAVIDCCVNAKGAIDKKAQEIRDWFNDKKEQVKEFVANTKGKVDNTFKDMKEKWDSLNTKGKELVANAKDNASGIIDKFKGKWDSIVSKTPELAASAKNNSENVLNGLKNAWDTITNKKPLLEASAKNKDGSVLSTLKSSWENIYNKKVSLTASAKNKSAKALKTIRNAWKDITQKSVKLTASFVDNFTAPIKRAWNTLARSINSMLNKIPVIGSKVSKLPLFNGYATGGFPEEGPFMMNRGEIAGKFSNGKGVVANNIQITKGISNAVGPSVYSAVKSAFSSSSIRIRTPQLATVTNSNTDKTLEKMMDILHVIASGSINSETIAVLKEILTFIKTMDRDVYMDGEKVTKIITDIINRNTDATGACLIKV